MLSLGLLRKTWLYSRARDGDLIEFKRAYGVYCHWAVYIGNGYVVNYGRKDPTPAIVQKEKLIIKVAEDCPCRINNLTGAASDLNLTPFPRDEIVERTLAKVGKKYEYKLSKNNCECFATECRYGTGFTCQPTEAVIAAGWWCVRIWSWEKSCRKWKLDRGRSSRLPLRLME